MKYHRIKNQNFKLFLQQKKCSQNLIVTPKLKSLKVRPLKTLLWFVKPFYLRSNRPLTFVSNRIIILLRMLRDRFAVISSQSFKASDELQFSFMVSVVRQIKADR